MKMHDESPRADSARLDYPDLEGSELNFELDLDELPQLELEELQAIRDALVDSALPESLTLLRRHVDLCIAVASAPRLSL